MNFYFQVLDFLMLMLSCAVIIQRIDEEGDKFMCAGAFLAFIVCVILSLISSIILLCFYITVYQSKTNQRLKSWVNLHTYLPKYIYDILLDFNKFHAYYFR